MKITDLLSPNVMILNLKGTTKHSVIEEMVEELAKNNRITDSELFKTGILAREAQTSTGLGDGIAMPHAKNAAVKKATVLFAKSHAGVDYDALDGQPTYLFFMIAAPEGANDTHLQALAGLSRLLMKSEFTAKLKDIETAEEVYALFSEAERDDEESAQQNTEVIEPLTEDQPFVVAVTACPTGIAHTYMAEDALKTKAKEMGIAIKVETNGSDGIKHALTSEEISRAKGVIVAADKQVEMARFAGKPVLNRPVSDGIRKTEELLTKASLGEAPLYQSSETTNTKETENSSGSIGSQIYKHLMNGVSNMLPFVIGGGIVIALAFMLDQGMGVPQTELANLGSYNFIPSQLKMVGDAAFSFMLPILAGFIASSIADRPGLVAGFVAGALAASGGAGFLGALIGGFVAGYVLIFLKKLLAKLPQSLAGIRTILFYPVLGVLITGALMLLINIPMQAVNTGLNNFLNNLSGVNAALLGALLAGMMSVDLGGPVNKAAYVFGTGTLATTVASGGSTVMAAVMAGGMVPPLAIFIATLLFKNKFSEKDQQAGLTNLVMGASFITEGAIPFAAADPLRTIPAFVVGSAITGSLVSNLGIKLMAPHGGIFVILLVNRPLLYIGFIILGAFISAFILGAIRKPVPN
ncbi:PTS fructose transporter subunit IIABC [Vagococcus intermedius]|uniref:Fructose-specific PTS transporter subunit EIIC n=1 Tax=Vagococcus intermedius TaxID=2991418 RepID=A0AAF0I6R0_9ENTE|nr:fructose-specific PTS transporter subunit EIIC [Vagococcus intermedius]WEG72825.1 fructose-specific PTS transporter subunit EIIC [Vagococcus intermedius]WEG74911.1 fructose-specific PTS transporter subunit EIIC [Vagococcus intermedius]